MHDLTVPKLSKWLFLLGSLLLWGVAIAAFTRLPANGWQMLLIGVCAICGAGLMVIPVLLDHRAAVRLIEAQSLAEVVGQIKGIEAVAAQISGATGQWQEVQGQAAKTAAGAREIAEQMAAELKSFMEFMQKANDAEKAALRLQVEKLHRVEGDWLQVLVRMLDHTYALNQGAQRSGQPGLIQQLGLFQDACRDAARRVGLTPFEAAPAEPFDPQKHQLVEDQTPPAEGGVVGETLATGYTFQGRPLRPVLVRLQNGSEKPAPQAPL